MRAAYFALATLSLAVALSLALYLTLPAWLAAAISSIFGGIV